MVGMGRRGSFCFFYVFLEGPCGRSWIIRSIELVAFLHGWRVLLHCFLGHRVGVVRFRAAVSDIGCLFGMLLLTNIGVRGRIWIDFRVLTRGC